MHEDLTGRQIGQYELIKLIGRGGAAVVYHARQSRVQRDVALKVVMEPYARHPAFVHRFEQEVHTSARLQHPHILPVYDMGMEDRRLYLVMAYMPGGPLSHRIAAYRGGLPLTDVVHITAEVASALDYAHEQGIVHRDVKPSNVLLDERGHAYLSDFGIAQLAGDELESILPPGTYEYMAPELAESNTANPASDIYSLGVMLFEMLTGRRPFYAQNRRDLIEAHAEMDVPNIQLFRPGLPLGVRVVVEQALIKDPLARPPHASSLALALARAAEVEAAFAQAPDVSVAGGGVAPRLGTWPGEPPDVYSDEYSLFEPLTPLPEPDDPDTNPVMPSRQTEPGMEIYSESGVWLPEHEALATENALQAPGVDLGLDGEWRYGRSWRVRIPVWLVALIVIVILSTLCVVLVLLLLTGG